jgi:hypothetical protein
MTAQLTLSLEPGASAHPSLKACIAAGIYQRGVVAVAGKLDRSPSHLSEALAGADRRKFDVDDLEAYIAKTGDTTPIQYLCAKYLQDASVVQAEAMARLVGLAEALPALIAAAGLQTAAKVRR